jgi:hypothetical protein
LIVDKIPYSPFFKVGDLVVDVQNILWVRPVDFIVDWFDIFLILHADVRHRASYNHSFHLSLLSSSKDRDTPIDTWLEENLFILWWSVRIMTRSMDYILATLNSPLN